MPRTFRSVVRPAVLSIVGLATLASLGCDGGVGAGVPDNRVSTTHVQQSQEDVSLAPGDPKAVEIIEAPIDPAQRSFTQE